MESVEGSPENPLALVKAREVVTPITANSQVIGQRNFLDAMETEEEGSSETTKQQNIEVEGELVEVVRTETKKKQVKIKGPAFEMQQYEFS